MAKLTFKYDITIDVPSTDQTLKCTFEEIQRKQAKALEKKFKDTTDAEAVLKARLDLSLSGDDKDALMKLGELYSYSLVFDAVIEAVKETKEGNVSDS